MLVSFANLGDWWKTVFAWFVALQIHLWNPLWMLFLLVVAELDPNLDLPVSTAPFPTCAPSSCWPSKAATSRWSSPWWTVATSPSTPSRTSSCPQTSTLWPLALDPWPSAATNLDVKMDYLSLFVCRGEIKTWQHLNILSLFFLPAPSEWSTSLRGWKSVTIFYFWYQTLFCLQKKIYIFEHSCVQRQKILKRL